MTPRDLRATADALIMTIEKHQELPFVSMSYEELQHLLVMVSDDGRVNLGHRGGAGFVIQKHLERAGYTSQPRLRYLRDGQHCRLFRADSLTAKLLEAAAEPGFNDYLVGDAVDLLKECSDVNQ